MGDKLLAQHPNEYTLYGPNNAYDEAVKQLIEAIHSGDPQKIESILNDLKAIQTQYAPMMGENIIKEGKKLKEEVERRIEEQREQLKKEEEEVKEGFMWPYIPEQLPEARKLLKEIQIISRVPPGDIRRVITGNTLPLSLNDLFFPPGSEAHKQFIQDTVINGGTPTVFPSPDYWRRSWITSPMHYTSSPNYPNYLNGFPPPQGPNRTPITRK
jgi:hypothetical protein